MAHAVLQLTLLASRSGCQYERAYCLFRLGRYAEALQLLEAMDLASPAAAFREIELKAQTVRMGRSAGCISRLRRSYPPLPTFSP